MKFVNHKSENSLIVKNRIDKNRLSIIKNQEGVAIIWVVILFLIVTIIATAVVFYARQDMLETNNQEDRLEAYYIAASGIEIGYAALMAPDSTPGPQYIDRFNASKADVSHSHILKDGVDTVGTVDITIGNVIIEGKRWIQIKAIGKVAESNVSQSSIMRIDPDNHLNIVREKD